MPKRKCDKRVSYNYLSKKLKKLEREIKRGRYNRHGSTSSSDGDYPKPYNLQECESVPIDDDYATCRDDPQPGCSYWEPAPTEYSDDGQIPIVSQLPTVNNTTAQDSMSSTKEVTVIAAPPLAAVPASDHEPAPASAPVLTTPGLDPSPATQLLELSEHPPASDVPELDPELMIILGEDPTCTKEYGTEIQKDLAIRLNHIATNGLSKENRKELKDRYLVPINCKLIKAPTLNPEIRAALVETQAKRDKGIESKQILMSCALSSISEAITLLLSSDHKDPDLLKLLMDTARILGDIQYSDSNSRRMFILSTVKKELKDQLEKTKIDELLFGSSLTDTLKSAKTIIKSGADLRSSSTVKSTAQRPARGANKPLNYRAPPANRRQYPPPPPGGARYSRAAPSTSIQRQQTRSAHNNASRTSSRQPQPRQRR